MTDHGDLHEDATWRALGLAAPARRALLSAGIRSTDELGNLTAADVSALHGIGAHALSVLAPFLAPD